jgi:hypothetical protein
MLMAHKKRKKGHARKSRKKGRARGKLGRRYGHSSISSPIRMNVSGQLVLDPERLEAVVAQAVETAAAEVIPEVVEDAAEDVADTLVPEVPDYYPVSEYH